MRGADLRLEMAVRDAIAVFAKFGVDVKGLFPTGDEVKRSYESGRLILRLRIAASTTGERLQWQACTIVSGSRRRFMRQSNSARRAGSLPSLALIAIGRASTGSPAAIWLT